MNNKDEIWRKIATGWRTVTFAEQATHGGGCLEEYPCILEEIEAEIQEILGPVTEQSPTVGIEELLGKDLVTSELEDLLFEIQETRSRVESALNHLDRLTSLEGASVHPTIH